MLKIRLFCLTLICTGILGLLHACTVPDVPTGLPSNIPSGLLPSSIPSEAPDSGEPACFQRLQCIVDNTGDNVLRRETQESINQLFLLEEPDYTQFCQAKAEEFLIRVPQCQT